MPKPNRKRRDHAHVPPDTLDDLGPNVRKLLAKLTGAERQVYRMFAQERGNAKRIAGLRGNADQTVKNQLAIIRDKVGADGRQDLLMRMLEAMERDRNGSADNS